MNEYVIPFVVFLGVLVAFWYWRWGRHLKPGGKLANEMQERNRRTYLGSDEITSVLAASGLVFQENNPNPESWPPPIRKILETLHETRDAIEDFAAGRTREFPVKVVETALQILKPENEQEGDVPNFHKSLIWLSRSNIYPNDRIDTCIKLIPKCYHKLDQALQEHSENHN